MKASDHIANILSKHTSVIFGGQISLSSNLFINEIKNYLQNINNLKIVIAKDIETSALRGVCKLLINNEHKRSLKK